METLTRFSVMYCNETAVHSQLCVCVDKVDLKAITINYSSNSKFLINGVKINDKIMKAVKIFF